ncbi:hypothetical protein COY28_03255 [Candidatus Woesearchaeota archaeon CG_4_10_14_0_2_um_filter_57_5]|nr:MAG: hypothetical protein AUJ68_03190 [Candidatus Woesearchaeota archaeon CG1_02_57_44]PIN68227.1 MAG: hypothetical protein COV94_05840 [Candidatus Woesearchaeota archaeon CG11_big_fil_rev_8_21_14_0_20_57_5]PIZ53840.1 MAG: hypothetical protein COY28_03255 [Candidatus Woesearchaeota archaeon CG_4_10_14_0_2_um_filter_57_5]
MKHTTRNRARSKRARPSARAGSARTRPTRASTTTATIPSRARGTNNREGSAAPPADPGAVRAPEIATNQASAQSNRQKYHHDRRAKPARKKSLLLDSVARRRRLASQLEKAGLGHLPPVRVSLRLFQLSVGILFFLSVWILIQAIPFKPNPYAAAFFILGLWTAVLLLVLLMVWFVFLAYLDVRTYQRTKAVEEVLPDFLQYTASNISAGMSIDRALWYAVRPRFGVFAKEIEDVAKSTISGEELSSALTRFANKYDSVTLQRSINLLLEGMAAGGQLADLLNKISMNLRETRIMKKQMSANITTYVIFINFATLIAAPFLFALSTQLATIIQDLIGTLVIDKSSSSMSTLQLSADVVSVHEFRIFCMVVLTLSAVFSTLITGTIKKGNARESMLNIPTNIAITLGLYLIATKVLSTMLGSFF